MSKLFKNSKQIFALVMAFAILAVSLFTGVVSAEDGTTALCGGSVVYWNGTADNRLNDNAETGTESNPIIIDSAEELNYLVNSVSGSSSKGKFYKMADGIDTIVLQPESIAKVDSDNNGVYDIFELTDGEKTKAYFDGITPTNWITTDNELWFDGSFDGNGVTIVGMYAVGCSAGLFPTADGDASFKNITVASSYIMGVLNSPRGKTNGQCRTGAIVGGTCGVKYGAKVAGTVSFDTIMVINNYIYGERGVGAAAVIMGANNGEETITLNSAVVYGNKAACKEDTSPLYLINGFDGSSIKNTITNSVVLGTSPYPLNYSKNTAGVDCFENVITDANVAPWDDKADYEDTDLKSVADLSAYQIVKEYSNMFKLFHNDVTLVQTGKTHSLVCEKCNFVFYGGEVEHTYGDVAYDDEHKCLVCEYVHVHTDQTIDPNFEGNCVTPPGYFVKCNDCLAETILNPGVAPGHTLEWEEEKPADCEHEGAEEGRLGYWHCTVCGGNFTGTEAEALNAAMETSIADPDNDERLRIPLIPHNATNRVDGSIQIEIVGNDGHYWVCYTCDGKLLAEVSKKVETTDKVKKHNYENGVCVDCGWECPEHDYQLTGRILVAGSCTVDREDEVKCTNCGNRGSIATPAAHNIQKVDEIAATDKLEGTKAHYACTVCGEIYADAEGKTKVTTASLVIPKVLPAEYQNVVVGGDTSTKSPATSDSLVSVMAVAALAGVAFVIARKAKNA